MKKVNSCSSYNQFRKKSSTLNLTTPNDIFQITKLAMQLQTLNQARTNSNKYEHPNRIKQEEEEDDSFNPLFQTKNKTIDPTIKKLKSITQNIHTNIRKGDIHKMNRTMESSVQSKKEKQISKNKDIRQNEPIKAPKKEEKNSKLISRRMSLNALSFSSTTQSSTTLPSQSDKPISTTEKKKLIQKVRAMEIRISKTSITKNNYEQIFESIQKLNQILDDC